MLQKTEYKNLVIAGGGTGGHVLAGISVAESWVQHCNKQTEVFFIGTKCGLETVLVPKAGFSLKTLWIGPLNQVSFLKKIKTIFQLPLSFVQSFFILLKIKPQFVLGVGGYSSGPVLLVAKFLKTFFFFKIRIGIIEQNSVPGLTNKFLGRFAADIIFLTFPNLNCFFGKKTVYSGNPIRSQMKPLSPASRDPFVVFIFGGSQGSIGINSLMLEALPYLVDLKTQLQFIHQTGKKDNDRVLNGYKKMGFIASVVPYVDDIVLAYKKASLLICRAGSSTLSEVAAVGRASLLIPLPTAADQHQEKNAQIFVKEGAACLLSQLGADGNILASYIRDFFKDPKKISLMEQKVKFFFKPDAAQNVVYGLLDLIKVKGISTNEKISAL